MLNLRHPFFNPFWRRLAVVAVCFLWGIVEMSTGAVFWAVIFLGLGAVAGYVYFLDWEDIPEEEK